MLSMRSQLFSSFNFKFSSLGDKIVQNVKLSSVSQNSDLILKLDSIHQHESRGMLGFQNRAPKNKLLNFHANQDERTYLEKHNF